MGSKWVTASNALNKLQCTRGSPTKRIFQPKIVLRSRNWYDFSPMSQLLRRMMS
jgi:hypothetical protein